MAWKNYVTDTVWRYGVDISGWPEGIPFGDLSFKVTHIRDMERLFHHWSTGATKFYKLSDDELTKKLDEYYRKIGTGEIREAGRKERSDKGKPRAKPVEDSMNEEEIDGQRKRRNALNAKASSSKRQKKTSNLSRATIEDSDFLDSNSETEDSIN